MEQKIMEVLRCMQNVLSEEELLELKQTLSMIFSGCVIREETSLIEMDDGWRIDLEDFLMAKTLEGRSAETMKRYRYELNRLLSYTNKRVSDITSSDILKYMQMYKSIRKISNQTLKNVRAIYSSFFCVATGQRSYWEKPNGVS